MSSRCIHRDEDGEQCPRLTDIGLFCTIHVEEGAVRPADVKPGGGDARNTLLQKTVCSENA
jgi:hypothetical protein